MNSYLLFAHCYTAFDEPQPASYREYSVEIAYFKVFSLTFIVKGWWWWKLISTTDKRVSSRAATIYMASKRQPWSRFPLKHLCTYKMEENIKWHLGNENSIEFSTQTHKCYFNKRMQVGWLDRFQAFWYKIRKLKWRLSGNVLKIFDIGEQHTLAIKLIVRVFLV